ncbi:MAG: alpha/beta fold hydrolase [Acidimicrobiales bacterium]
MSETPLWFGPAERPLFGWVHAPSKGLASRAVVLCPPLARELTNSHYPYRVLARQLAEAGMLVVRFDYDGTGDSAGGDSDPDRVEAWLSSIGQAVGVARRAGLSSVSLVGLRIGALLAAVTAARLGSIDRVVLWDPCRSARSFVREQAMLQKVVLDGHQVDRSGTELPGCVLSDDTVAELGSLTVPVPDHGPNRVLLLTRPGRSTGDELADALGAETYRAPAIGQDRLLDVDLLVREAPSETIGIIVSWLAAVPSKALPFSVPESRSGSWSVGGSIVTERAVDLGPTGLFGIVTEPVTGPRGPTIVMLNSGNNYHVGPNRLWVDLARRWASTGFRCVRMDESGLGDSPTRPGLEPQVIWAPETFDDLDEARDVLEPDDPGNFVLVGLCSGGYQALEDALRRPVRAVYAINPSLHFTPPELANGPMDPRRRICWPTSNLAAAYRKLAIEPVRRRLCKLAWRFAGFRNRHRKPSDWLDQLRTEGVEVLIIAGEEEARPFAPVGGRPSSPDDHDPICIEVIEALDHALMPLWQRRNAAERMTAHLLAHFGEPGSRVPTSSGVRDRHGAPASNRPAETMATR